jgi:hypothetical protein
MENEQGVNMNPFNTHPQQQGISYFTHLCFALGIAVRLLHSVIVFAAHGVFPFINIPREQDLDAITHYLQQRNRWIESKKPVPSMADQFALPSEPFHR